MKRRTLLKGALSASAVTVAVGAGLLAPQTVLAAWPKAAFKAKKIDVALKDLLGSTAAANSKDIKIKAPPIAENGAEVGITVSSTLANVESIAILVQKNNSPLAAHFKMKGADAFVRTRIKIAKTSNVMAVVRSGGKLFSTKREVKVTIGGCGG